MRGFVYVLTNPAMPHIVKVGCTRHSPYQRAGILSSSTGVPLPFEVALYGEFHRCRAVEQHVHQLMNGMRLNVSREFFSGNNWMALKVAAGWICNHPQLIGEPRVSLSVLTKCRIESTDELLNPWKATM